MFSPTTPSSRRNNSNKGKEHITRVCGGRDKEVKVQASNVLTCERCDKMSLLHVRTRPTPFYVKPSENQVNVQGTRAALGFSRRIFSLSVLSHQSVRPEVGGRERSRSGSGPWTKG